MDYGNQNVTYRDLDVYSDLMPLTAEYPSLYYNQFLANLVYAMGMPSAELPTFNDFTNDGHQRSEIIGGYGFHYVAPQKFGDYLSAKGVVSERLPIVSHLSFVSHLSSKC